MFYLRFILYVCFLSISKEFSFKRNLLSGFFFSLNLIFSDLIIRSFKENKLFLIIMLNYKMSLKMNFSEILLLIPLILLYKIILAVYYIKIIKET